MKNKDRLNLTYILVDKKTFIKFQQMLENPPEPSEGLRQLMQVKAPWEKPRDN